MSEADERIRAAAGASIEQQIQKKGTNVFTWEEIDKGFELDGQKIHYATKAAGIFKPKEVTDGAALSIKQVSPSRIGRRAPYSDRSLGDGIFEYRLQRQGEKSHFNSLLNIASLNATPLIFFRGIADSSYEVLYPVFVERVSYEDGSAWIVFERKDRELDSSGMLFREEAESRYGVGFRKTRLHQVAFRKRVLLAYGLRCALTNLPLVSLLEAAHIVKDADGGEPSVTNGIAMTPFHHVAYDKNLMGIDPDGRIHLHKDIVMVRDGPMFDHGLLRLEGTKIRLPQFQGHQPSKNFLAQRFEQFLKS